MSAFSKGILTVALAASWGLVEAKGATITGVAGGTGAPGATLGPYSMTQFAADSRPVFTDVTTVASPLGGDVSFAPAVNHRKIGAGWATWSHGYTGDVYYSNGATSLTMTMPADTAAFYFYAEPNPFSSFVMTARADDGTTVSQTVSGSSGASYFGFYTDNSVSLTSVSISAGVDFAAGEFGIAERLSVVPLPPAIAGGAFLLLGLAAGKAKQKLVIR